MGFRLTRRCSRWIPPPRELENARTGVTTAELGITSYGSLVIKDTPDGTESVSLFPDLHVAVVRASDVVKSMPAAFERLGLLIRDEKSSAILETAPAQPPTWACSFVRPTGQKRSTSSSPTDELPVRGTNGFRLREQKAAKLRQLMATEGDAVAENTRGSTKAATSRSRKWATTTSWDEALSDQLAADWDIVVIEPSDLAMFRREYEKLLLTDRYDPLSEQSYEIMEYVYGLLENGADPAALAADRGEKIAYHSHCQQRTLGLAAYTSAVLDALGHDVVTSDIECCGMAGSFGYKTEYYELSMKVGSQLAEQFRTQDAADRTVVASGTSCLDQLDTLLERPATHPLEIIDSGPSP